jgi:hypothetical protein
MARLPRDVRGWVTVLRKQWPRGASRPEVIRGLSSLVGVYLRADAAGRATIRAHVNEPLGDELYSFAHRAAEKAVRRKDREYLTRGLAALAIGDEWIDPRDILRAFSLIDHSAGKLRMKYRRLFERVLELGGKPFAELVEDWLDREDYERTIDGMGFKEAGGGRFRYVEDDDDLW